jgi:hypothetical protein
MLQVLSAAQFALQVLPVWQTKLQLQLFIGHENEQLAAAPQLCAQHGLHVVVQSDEHCVARSGPTPRSVLVTFARSPVAASTPSSVDISPASSGDDINGSPVRLKLHPHRTTTNVRHHDRIDLLVAVAAGKVRS